MKFVNFGNKPKPSILRDLEIWGAGIREISMIFMWFLENGEKWWKMSEISINLGPLGALWAREVEIGEVRKMTDFGEF